MQYVLILAIVFIFIKTASYSLWEKNENDNLSGSIGVFILATCTLAVIFSFI